ncbi:MAG: outer membrane lipoprotein SlyB [Pirellulaceae bacterium]
MQRTWIVATLILVASGCTHTDTYRQQGTLVGGGLGALVGAAIGEHNNETLAGTAIGTAVGAMVGNTMGQTVDNDLARAQAITQQRIGRQLSSAVTTQDVIEMSRAQLGDEVIMTQIRANGVRQRPSVDDLIALRNSGVSNGVLTALQQAHPPVTSPVRRPPTVIVEERYVVPAVAPRSYWHGRGNHYPVCRPVPSHHRGGHWGVSIHN